MDMKTKIDTHGEELVVAVFQDMTVMLVCPVKVHKKHGRNINTRCYEKLKGKHENDDWTKKMDKLIEDHGITYEQITDADLQVFLKNRGSNDFVANL